RKDLMEQLRNKLSGEEAGAWLLTGPEGFGKTRLLTRIKELLQLEGRQPLFFSDLKSAATFLEKSENFSAPLLLDLAETSKHEGPLLSQLLRRPGLRVLLASPHLEDQVMTPTFHLEPLSAKQISDFCQAEFKGFAAEHWEEPLRQFSGGNPLRLEYLFQAMREA